MRKIDEDYLAKRFQNTYKFCDKNLDKFCLMLRKGIFPHEYMDSCQRFNQKSLPDKERILQQTDNGKHHRHSLNTQKVSGKILEYKN